MQFLPRSFTAIAIVLLTGCASAPPPVSHVAAPELVAFVHASVIPMDAPRVLRDQTVLTRRGKIVEVGPASAVKVPREALRIDASGRYLLPAFCDMHVHVEGESWNALLTAAAREAGRNLPFEKVLWPYVANGVTTVQVLSGTPELLVLRDQIDRGEVLAPRMILARMIDGPDKAWPPPLSTWVASAAEAGEATVRAREEGYDKIKVYSFLSKEAYDAIISTAREQEMDVIGHVPMVLSVEYVVDAGQKMIAHTEEVAKHAHGDYSPERIDYYARRIAGGKVWMTPTLVTTRAILDVLDDPEATLSRPESAYFRHPMQEGIWTFITQNLYRPIPAGARVRLREDFEKFQRPLTKAFHESGGQLMTGTDSLFPALVPGFALHHELQELVDVGLTPYEALRTSTTIPWEYLGEADRAGTIEAGKEPDMILVDANPLEDIAAASRISGVFMRGRWFAREEIDRRMREVEALKGAN